MQQALLDGKHGSTRETESGAMVLDRARHLDVLEFILAGAPSTPVLHTRMHVFSQRDEGYAQLSTQRAFQVST